MKQPRWSNSTWIVIRIFGVFFPPFSLKSFSFVFCFLFLFFCLAIWVIREEEKVVEQTQAKKGKDFSNPQWLQGCPWLIPPQVFPPKKKIASISLCHVLELVTINTYKPLLLVVEKLWIYRLSNYLTTANSIWPDNGFFFACFPH